MIRSILLPLLFFSSILGSQAQVVLVDQSTPATTNGLVAQDFEALFNGNDCRIADDFTVPSGETWYIDSVELYGFYSVTNPDSAGMNFTIYNDNSGTIGSQVYSEVIEVNLDENEDGTITASWSTPIQLGTGTYWLAASARKNYINDAGVWYWYLNSSTSLGYTAQWENPGGSWAAGCTSWTPITSSSCVNVAHPNVMFRVYGCYGATKPSINELGNDTTFCEGPVVTLNASSSTNGVDYVWNTGDSTQSIDVSTGGIYSVTAYDPITQCGSHSSINMNIIPAPQSTVQDDTICPGQSRTFGVNNCPSCTYLWDDGSTANFLTVSNQGWVSVTITDTVSGCVGVDSGWLQIQPLTQPIFVPGNEVHLCTGDTIDMYTQQQFETYNWESTAWTSPVANDSIEVYLTGTYYLTVTSASGCTATDSVAVTVHDPPQPDITIDYTANWKTRLTGTPGYQTYVWSTGSGNVAIIANTSGVYSLTVSDEFGCEGEVSLFVIVTGVENPIAHQLNVFPNPAHNQLTMEWPEAWLDKATARVTDLGGRVVTTFSANALRQQVDIGTLSKGYYIIHVNTPEGMAAIPIVKE